MRSLPYLSRLIMPLLIMILTVSSLSIGYAHPDPTPPPTPFPPTPPKRDLIYGVLGIPSPLASATTIPPYHVRPQGNDSNCDYIAVSNGVQNTGGDGEYAYWRSRELVPQEARDFREVYYTILGENGSDQPFTPDNLGAAPEAFVGVYEMLGYNVVSLSTTPGSPDRAFAQAIRDRLAADPTRTFAHLWITPPYFDSHARVITVPETGELVPLPYPYHEVVAMAAPDSNDAVIILDGLVGYPYALSLDDLAQKLQGFNRVIVASRHDGTLEEHQQIQIGQSGQPFVDYPLGGPYLRTARQFWGADYRTWGSFIGSPFKTISTDDQREQITAFSDYVQYERLDARTVILAPLGIRMAQDLERVGVIHVDDIHWDDAPPLSDGHRHFASETFRSEQHFFDVFGKTLTPEFWMSAQHMRTHVLLDMPLLDHLPGYAQIEDDDGFMCSITERAMIAWNQHTGAFLVPLGHIYYQQFVDSVMGNGNEEDEQENISRLFAE